MKAILTKSEKERLLEQFEKSGKTYAQFADPLCQDRCRLMEGHLYEVYNNI